MVFLLLVAGSLLAQQPAIMTGDEPGWYKIGEMRADFEKERESIIVMGKDEFSSLRLRAVGEAIEIDLVQVYFEGGKIQEEEVKQPLKPGEETREITLNADNTEIDRVVFSYRTAPNSTGKKAKVELYGMKGNESSSVGGSSGTTADTLNERQDTLETSNGLNDQAEEVEDKLERTTEQAAEGIESGATELKEETNEAASKVGAAITDEKLEDKTGPGGQTIYVDEDRSYYWIDEQGNKNYISPVELKDKE